MRYGVKRARESARVREARVDAILPSDIMMPSATRSQHGIVLRIMTVYVLMCTTDGGGKDMVVTAQR